MTDKQQIEEMLKLDIDECAGFYSAFINDMRISKNKPLSVSKTIMSFDCPKEYILRALGIPENAVVLTEEEYNTLMLEQKRLKKIVDRIPCGYELKDKTRKQTAKEILQEVRKVCGDYQWFKNLCKQYGVEVDND